MTEHKPMRSNLKTLTLAGVASAMLLAAPAFAQKKAAGETGLLGIKLFDNAVRIVNRFGTPDDIQAIGVGGGGAIGGRGGAPGGMPGGIPGGIPGGPAGIGGPPGGFAPRGGGGGGMMPGIDGAAAGGFRNSEFAFGDEVLNQMAPPGGLKGGQGPRGGGSPFGSGAPGGMGGPPAGFGGPPSGAFGQGGPGGIPGGFGGGFPGAGAPGGIGSPTTSQETTFTRWIYNRDGCKYGFILDKFSRVVQIEAIGLSNPNVRTSRGVKFGANFAQLIRAYAGSSPDGYEISGNSIVVRFLSKHNVAYRLNRLGPNSPHVVTGIVVAAGKG